MDNIPVLSVSSANVFFQPTHKDNPIRIDSWLVPVVSILHMLGNIRRFVLYAGTFALIVNQI